MPEIYARYGERHWRTADARSHGEADADFFAARREESVAFEIGGTDIAGVALEYAAALGFVDRTFHEDLVGDAPSEELRQFLGGVTLASQADSSTERKVVYPPSVERKLRIISDFHSWVGANKKPRDSIHQGIDIAGRSGQRVIAIVDGLVVETHVEKCWGPTVVIDHGMDKDGKPLIALYGHVGKFLVREGQTVSRGDVIARLGNNQRKFKCMFRVRHLHLQLGRIRRLVKGTYWGHAYFLLDAFNAVNPHLLWADGPYRVTCLDKKRRYPRGTLTYPMPCG